MKIPNCDALLVCHDNDRGYIFDQKYYAQYMDSFFEYLNRKQYSSKVIAKPFSRFTGDRAFGYPFTINRARLLILLRSFIKKIFNKKNQYSSWGDEKRIVSLWKDILKTAQPKVVFGIQPEKALCIAGVEMGIPVYDLQHGVIQKEDEYYNRSKKNSYKSEDMPNGFLCWNEETVEILKESLADETKDIIAIGNLWLERFLQPDPKDTLVNEAMNIHPTLDRERPTILVSLHRSLQREYNHNNQNSLRSIDTLEKIILNTADKYNWLLRLHPVQIHGWQSKSIRKYLIDLYGGLKNVEWMQCSKLALPIVLSWSDIHITHHSSVTIDASLMNVPTALIAPHMFAKGKYDDLFQKEREMGFAEIVEPEVRILAKWIENKLIKNDQISNLKNIVENYSERREKFINKLFQS